MAINTGTILRINLTTGATSEETVPRQIAEDFVGGRGYGIRYLYDELKPGTDPLGPDNKVLMIAGPLAGTAYSAVSRRMRDCAKPMRPRWTGLAAVCTRWLRPGLA